MFLLEFSLFRCSSILFFKEIFMYMVISHLVVGIMVGAGEICFH